MHTRQNAITGLLSNAINDETSGKTAILYECKKKPPAYSRRLGYNCPGSCFAPMATYTVYALPIQVSSNLKMQQSACRFTIDARVNREH